MPRDRPPIEHDGALSRRAPKTVKIVVRNEAPADLEAIRAVHRAAFGVSVEADLVDRLRSEGDLLLSLVAENDGNIVGHCGFSRLAIGRGEAGASAVSLAPVAVLPVGQRRGVGQAMIRDGIARLKQAGESLIVVLGEPAYYSRFGFSAEAARAYRTPYDGPYLQVLRLSGLAPKDGEVRYPAAFASL